MDIGTPPSIPRKQKRIGWTIILLALAIGLFTSDRCIDKLRSASWPATHAEILTSDVRKRVKSLAWCLQLRYQYVIDNKPFESSRWSLDNSMACYRDKQVAHALLGRVQPGAKVPIRYDPSDPGKSIVYVVDVNFLDFLFLAVAIVLLVTGILLLKTDTTGSRRQG